MNNIPPRIQTQGYMWSLCMQAMQETSYARFTLLSIKYIHTHTTLSAIPYRTISMFMDYTHSHYAYLLVDPQE